MPQAIEQKSVLVHCGPLAVYLFANDANFVFPHLQKPHNALDCPFSLAFSYDTRRQRYRLSTFNREHRNHRPTREEYQSSRQSKV